MKRTGRSPLFSHLHRAFDAARRENHRRVGGHQPPRVTRRRFLTGAAAGLIATYARPAQAANGKARIAVVGAGIAGLNATYLLAQAGFRVALYEGSDHIGGRIQTNYGAVAPNVYTELGGEFIDSDHDDMLALAQMFGLGLIDTQTPRDAIIENNYGDAGIWIPALAFRAVCNPHVNILYMEELQSWSSRARPAFLYVGAKRVIDSENPFSRADLITQPDRYEEVFRRGEATVFRLIADPSDDWPRCAPSSARAIDSR